MGRRSSVGRKSGEVVFAAEYLRRFSQKPWIKGSRDVPGAVDFERRKHVGSCYSIAINFSAGRKPCVKGFWHIACPKNSDLRRQGGIERSLQCPWFKSRDDIGVGALP